ncbi:MAG: hypothetical protein WAL32_05590 [Terriglobales bacterium]
MNDPVMADLDRFLYESGSSQKLFPVLARILCTLDDSPNLPQAWEPLPGNFFGGALPGGIASCWAFALRGGGIFTNERHPNSWQRSIGIRGSALFEVYDDGRWQPRPVTASGVDLATRAVSIPPNMWHRITIGPETFVSLSFHTAPASELIEETCLGDDFATTKRRLYHP